ncbi:Uncharacterised protein [Mycobacteroides abscessus subsp. massiliense]|nr:Uncharacterised protein [Mycobacteroides abscessus subsp. massiliense]SKG29326.1 Uncharacterised protein [Mycobacteroides abscessus subsp. massiliense]SKH69155.1 Uncharacterised protein [Mycobacteroides abscessus subsp. massiliense]SKI50611.1 Uncharacterised protein [Mycobacteroides abscessus subsp. massiliense]
MVGVTALAVDAAGSLGGLAARSAGGAKGQRAGSASEASALGSTQSYCFTTSVTGAGGVGVVVGDSAARRRVRWGARAMLWQASSLKAVRCCGRMLHNDAVGDPDDGQGVVIKRREVDGRPVASLHGLMTCGSVWACPRCSAVIANTRAAEIGAAVRECYRRGGHAYLLTLTMRHSRRDGLADLWDSLGKGWRSVFGTRHWTGQKERTVQRKGSLALLPEIMGDAERFDIAGVTRVVEATYGRPELGGHGWHLHIHALVFSATSLSSALVEDCESVLGSGVDRDWLSRNVFAARIYQRWSQGLVKAGCRIPGSVAVDVREIDDEGADYVGRYLSKATYDAATHIGLEIGAGALTKDARAERNQTPFELLADLAESLDTRGFGIRTPRHWAVLPAAEGDWAVIDKDTGEILNITAPGRWKVWHEWERASSGRRQITWSRRRAAPDSAREVMWNALLDSRGASAALTNEEVAVDSVEGVTVAEICRNDWYRVFAWRPSLIVGLLEVAECALPASLENMLRTLDVELLSGPPWPS